jgi:hypothetical protein
MTAAATILPAPATSVPVAIPTDCRAVCTLEDVNHETIAAGQKPRIESGVSDLRFYRRGMGASPLPGAAPVRDALWLASCTTLGVLARTRFSGVVRADE